MKRKSIFAYVLAMCLCVGGFSGCFNSVEQSSQGSSSSHKEVESSLLYKNDSKKLTKLTSGQEIEITIDKEVEDNNYLTVKLVTDCNLLGYIHYKKTDETATAHREKIYIEADSNSFSMFLDAFRVGAFGAYEKTIEKITLRNVGKEEGHIRVSRIDISDRTYDNQEMLYMQNKHLKIGAWLAAGGSLCHVESLNRNVVEYIDKEGFIRIDQYMDKNALNADMGNVVTDKVNMVNVHDLGRVIQQSYYAHPTPEDGYAPDDDILYEGDFLYNPVQAGSAGDNQSQIIDYRVDESGIYVKCRPQDWFFRNTQTDSYMESTYTLHNDGTLRVTNRFVNFAEFKNMETAYFGGQETPAIYLVQPLNYFYCETRNGEIFDPNLLNAMDYPGTNSYDPKPNDGYYYNLHKNELLSEWFAFVNDQKFGVGIYMPKVDNVVASRGWTSTSYELDPNKSYRADIHGKQTGYVPSMCVGNYNYCSPCLLRQVVDYVPFEYTFALYVGTVSEMKGTFNRLKQNNTIPNDGVEAWKTRAF